MPKMQIDELYGVRGSREMARQLIIQAVVVIGCIIACGVIIAAALLCGGL